MKFESVPVPAIPVGIGTRIMDKLFYIVNFNNSIGTKSEDILWIKKEMQSFMAMKGRPELIQPLGDDFAFLIHHQLLERAK